ncbi:MAG: DNA polymerase IV [Gammaproteobacteria bacterium]
MSPSHRSWERIVAHADMDAFYAAVEQLDDPALRGRPILVGSKSRRSVVLTASYEARPFDVGSAMPMARAMQLCPDAVIVPPRFDRYEEMSVSIMKVFSDFSPDVEPLSLDEAFLEMSGAEDIFGPPASMGQRLKDAVREATGGLTVSVGLSSTKYVAKVASAHRKPDGLTLVASEDARAWLAPQSIARLWGAGSKTQAKLRELGFDTIGDVAAADRAYLVEQLGSAGARFHELSHARDSRPVVSSRKSKSIGSERTLHEDVTSREDIKTHLRRSADKIGKRLRRAGLVARGVRVKLKTSDFRLLTRQCPLNEPSDVADTLYLAGADLLQQFADPGPFRLVGMAAFDLIGCTNPQQLGLLGTSERQRRLEVTLDQITQRFGEDTVHRADEIHRTQDPRLSSDMDFLDAPEPD